MFTQKDLYIFMWFFKTIFTSVGRHEVFDVNNNNNAVSDEELEEILAIINNDEPIVMKKVSQVAVSELKDCCQITARILKLDCLLTNFNQLMIELQNFDST